MLAGCLGGLEAEREQEPMTFLYPKLNGKRLKWAVNLLIASCEPGRRRCRIAGALEER